MKLIKLPYSLPGFEVNSVCEAGELMEIEATSIQKTAKCPDCHTISRRVHRDYAKVPADLPMTEGQVNRLKLLKRQMYGRVNFDLLSFRFLHPP